MNYPNVLTTYYPDHIISEEILKMYELTDEECRQIAKKNPEWLAANRPSWMARYRPEWLAKYRPDLMSKYNPEWMAKYLPKSIFFLKSLNILK